jgi:hypothetical protein
MVCYWITNGRSTAEASLRSLKQQAGKHTIVEVHDMPVPDSFNQVLGCTEPFFTMAGDDFVLHPQALNHIEAIMRQTNKYTGLICWRLFDTVLWRSIEGMKAYNTEAVKRAGGFHLDHRGKMDNNIWYDLINNGYQNYKDGRSAIGLHIHGSLEDLDKYERLWRHTKQYRYRVMGNDRDIGKQLEDGFVALERFNNENKGTFYQSVLKKNVNKM